MHDQVNEAREFLAFLTKGNLVNTDDPYNPDFILDVYKEAIKVVNDSSYQVDLEQLSLNTLHTTLLVNSGPEGLEDYFQTADIYKVQRELFSKEVLENLDALVKQMLEPLKIFVRLKEAGAFLPGNEQWGPDWINWR